MCVISIDTYTEKVTIAIRIQKKEKKKSKKQEDEQSFQFCECDLNHKKNDRENYPCVKRFNSILSER